MESDPALCERFWDGVLVERCRVPRDAVGPLVAYLRRHGGRISLGTLTRIFLDHWNRGINLSK